MSDRDRVAQAICRADPLNTLPNGVYLDAFEDEAERYLAMADAAIEALLHPLRNVEITAAKSAVTVESTKRGTRLPEDWQPSDRVKAELVHRYPHLNFPLLLDEFRDYWCAIPGQRGLKLSWDRTFRNSVRERSHKPQYWLVNARRPMSKVDQKVINLQGMKE